MSIGPGREITVTTDTRPASPAVFVQADDAALTTLSLNRVAVADGVKRLLRASFTPDYIGSAGVVIGASLAVLGGFLIKQSRAPTIIYRR